MRSEAHALPIAALAHAAQVTGFCGTVPTVPAVPAVPTVPAATLAGTCAGAATGTTDTLGPNWGRVVLDADPDAVCKNRRFVLARGINAHSSR